MGKRSNFERRDRDFYPTGMDAVKPLISHLPIGATFEELLLSEIMFITDGFNPVQHLEFPEEHLVFGTWFECQYKVGKYRADFVFEVCVNGETQRVLVECDGHDYHEKTKEQAARDKKRDRYFTGQGYSILRFTGSEIFKSPEDCAEEIHELLSDVSSRLVRAHLDKGE